MNAPGPVVHCTCGAVQPREAFIRPFVLFVDEHEFARMGTCTRCHSTVALEVFVEREPSPCRVCEDLVSGAAGDPKVIVGFEVWCSRCALNAVDAHPFLARAKFIAEKRRARVA